MEKRVKDEIEERKRRMSNKQFIIYYLRELLPESIQTKFNEFENKDSRLQNEISSTATTNNVIQLNKDDTGGLFY